jgi:quercetin dioxygenase-like cupin family protein
MHPTDLPATVDALLVEAAAASTGRAARTLPRPDGWALRQTVLAILAGRGLAEHASPGEATLQVLSGRVRLTAGPEAWEAGPGQLLIIPEQRHSLAALEDAAVLLTVRGAR